MALTHFAKHYGEHIYSLALAPPRRGLCQISISPTYRLNVPRDDPAEKQAQGRIGAEDQPSSIELQQMVQRATAVAQLLDSLRIARLSEEGAATQNMATPVGSKRSWDTSQGINPPRPLKLIFESGQGPRSESEPTVSVPQASPPVSRLPLSCYSFPIRIMGPGC
jgi:hypothetical protein